MRYTYNVLYYVVHVYIYIYDIRYIEYEHDVLTTHHRMLRFRGVKKKSKIKLKNTLGRLYDPNIYTYYSL